MLSTCIENGRLSKIRQVARFKPFILCKKVMNEKKREGKQSLTIKIVQTHQLAYLH